MPFPEDDKYYRIVASNPVPDKLIRNLQKAQMIEQEKLILEANYQTSPLTDRERQVLIAMGDGGFTRQEAADALGISVETVKIHIKSCKSKLAAKTTTQAIVRAIRAGEI